MNGLTQRSSRVSRDCGFTLIELLVVVIIIGVLAAIAIPLYLAQQNEARGAKVESAIANAKTEIVIVLVEERWPEPGELADILDGHGDPQIDLTSTGDQGGFCIRGVHDLVDGSWAASDTTGVLADSTCAADGTVTAAP